MKQMLAATLAVNAAGLLPVLFYTGIILPPGASGPLAGHGGLLGWASWILVGTACLVLVWKKRWARLFDVVRGRCRIETCHGPGLKQLQQDALGFPLAAALLCLGLWGLAGLISGMTRPSAALAADPGAHMPVFSWLRHFLGISLGGGVYTCLFLFFALEHLWHPRIHLFFPEGCPLAQGLGLNIQKRFLFCVAVLALVPMIMIMVCWLALNPGFLGVSSRLTPLFRETAFICAWAVAAACSLSLPFSRTLGPSILAGHRPVAQEMKQVTLVFCDLRNFTAIAEGRHPRQVITLLNRYFSRMAQVVRAHNGMVIQYVGDEMEAVFGLDRKGHPDDAVRAALAMRKALDCLNRCQAAQGEPMLAHGIGIHTGRVLAGNVGSPDAFSYALVGDAVNTTSRIQGLTRECKTDILMSRATACRLTGTYVTRQLPPARLKGKTRPLTLFELKS